MAKKPKSSQQLASMKISKPEKKQPINSLIKILRPKVYITDSSNFRQLVQELTGNGKCSPVLSPPAPVVLPPSLSPPSDHHYHHQHQMSFQDHLAYDNLGNILDYSSSEYSSSCFSTPLEGSPDLQISEPGSFNLNYGIESQNIDFYKDLEALLMEDSGSFGYQSYDDHAPCYGMVQQEVCVYDYDIPTFI